MHDETKDQNMKAQTIANQGCIEVSGRRCLEGRQRRCLEEARDIQTILDMLPSKLTAEQELALFRLSQSLR